MPRLLQASVFNRPEDSRAEKMPRGSIASEWPVPAKAVFYAPIEERLEMGRKQTLTEAVFVDHSDYERLFPSAWSVLLLFEVKTESGA